MSDLGIQPAADVAPGLSQWQRVVNTFTAPSKTFEDIKRGHKSWWLPFLIYIVCGGILYAAITQQVTWKTVYENQQRQAPEFVKRMMENMPAEQRAKADAQGPVNQAVTWALSPLGLLAINLIAALILWPTINFGFGGKTTFGSILAVEMYAGLVLWPGRLLLGAIAVWAGAAPEGFNVGNPAPTNIAAFLNQQETPHALYSLCMSLDVLSIWCLVLTGIGVAIVAGVKRSSGYIAVFGWWALIVLISIGFAAAFS
jgi:hypothetical protein